MIKKYDVVTLATPAVDMQIATDDAHIAAHGLIKGMSNMVSAETAAKIAEGLSAIYSPGGAGANVAMGVALRGGHAALIGKISNDVSGQFITQRFKLHGVDFTPLLSENPTTGTTVVLVLTTPDKERSFAVAPGASMELIPEDVDAKLIAQAKIIYLDSYLWQTKSGREAVHHAAETAKKSGGKVALALNDAHLVAQHRTAILALASSHADILVGDKGEFMALFGTSTIADTAGEIGKLAITAAITAGVHGAYVVENGVTTHIPVEKIDEAKIVDTNGAGDQFAAGFLYSLSQGLGAIEAGETGSKWASDVIQHLGAEPKTGKNASPNIQSPQSPLKSDV